MEVKQTKWKENEEDNAKEEPKLGRELGSLY